MDKKQQKENEKQRMENKKTASGGRKATNDKIITCNSEFIIREQRGYITKTSPQQESCGEVYYMVSNIRASDRQQQVLFRLRCLHIS